MLLVRGFYVQFCLSFIQKLLNSCIAFFKEFELVGKRLKRDTENWKHYVNTLCRTHLTILKNAFFTKTAKSLEKKRVLKSANLFLIKLFNKVPVFAKFIRTVACYVVPIFSKTQKQLALDRKMQYPCHLRKHA